MSNAARSTAARPRPPLIPVAPLVAATVLVVWFVLVFRLGASRAFLALPGTPPLPILLGVTAPVVLFLAGFWLSRPFRSFVLGADLRLITGIQGWRFAGFGFLALYAHGVLPGVFAWPAGLGDIAIGITAPWIVLFLIRRSEFSASKWFRIWNLLGILDLIVAIGTGALSSTLDARIAGELTTRPMAELPLVLIPAFFVPIFIMLHAAALFQARRQAINSGEQA